MLLADNHIGRYCLSSVMHIKTLLNEKVASYCDAFSILLDNKPQFDHQCQ